MTYNSYLSFTSLAVETVQSLECCLASVMDWVRASGLKLNPNNMEILLLGGAPDCLGGILVWVTLSLKQWFPTLGLQMFLHYNSQKPSPLPLLAKISRS